MKKTVEKLEQLEVDSSIAAVIKQNIEESNKKQKYGGFSKLSQND